MNLRKYLESNISTKNFVIGNITNQTQSDLGQINFLWEGEYISIVSPENLPYEAVHGADCIIVLPYLKDTNQFVIRSETCPPYMIKDGIVRKWYTTVTGAIDNGEKPEEAMLRELREETGLYNIEYTIDKVFNNIPIFKCLTMRAWIYFITIESFDLEQPEGDGTEMEEKSKPVFARIDELDTIMQQENVDMLLQFVYRESKGTFTNMGE